MRWNISCWLMSKASPGEAAAPGQNRGYRDAVGKCWDQWAAKKILFLNIFSLGFDLPLGKGTRRRGQGFPSQSGQS